MEKKANNKRGGREKGVIANLQINNKTSEKKETYGGADKEKKKEIIHKTERRGDNKSNPRIKTN